MSLGRILIVDDDGAQRRLYRRLFEAQGLEALGADSALQALGMIRRAVTRPAIILCDITMPVLDGTAFLKALRAAPETAAIPAMLMTGRAFPRGMLDLVAETLGLWPVHRKGSDLGVLVSRVMSLLRAAAPRKEGVVIDSIKRAIWIDGVQLPELPARRFQLLCALLRRPRSMSREELLEHVWDGKENPNVVDVTVLRLREDLKDYPFLRIETVSAGYRLRSP